MASVEKGASRQVAHEAIRDHSVEVARRVKEEGLENDLLRRLAADDRIPLDAQELAAIALDPARFVGRAPQQVEEYLARFVTPRLAGYSSLLAARRENRVRV